jgi:hypothetical protein
LRKSLFGLMVVLGCASRPGKPTETRPTVPPPPPPRAGAVPALQATRLAEVPAGTSGPYLGLGQASGVVVWDQPETAELGGWRVLSLGADGRSRGPQLRVADAPPRLGLVAVRAAGPLAATQRGFLVVSSEQRGEAAVIHAMRIGVTGEPAGGPTLLEEQARAVLWVEAVPTQRGTLVLWAKRTDKTAQLDAAELDARGARVGVPHVVAEDVLAWQAVRGDGATAAWVGVVAADKPSMGTVSLIGLDASGNRRGAPHAVSTSPTANPDLDLARIGDRPVVGWSDTRDGEPKLYLATLDSSGAVRTRAAPATGSTDEETLVRIVSPMDPTGPGYLCWEDLTDSPEQGRSIRIAPVSANAELGPERAELRMADTDQLPEFAATRAGVAALTWAPICRKSESCDARPMGPTFVEFDSNLRVVASEPIRLEALSGKLASAAWGLGCRAAGCSALAAMPTSPTPVFSVSLAARSTAWKPAAGPLPPNVPPRVKSLATLSVLDPLSNVAAVHHRNQTLATWITYFDSTAPTERPKKPAPDGRLEPVRARLEVQAIPDGQAAPLPAQTISYRAQSVGGVALAPGDAERDEALLVWSALDYNVPEVFLTLVGAGGKKLVQHVLTHNRAPVSDVAAARVSDGWIVGWVDERRGECEVLVAKVDQKLGRVGPERRLTTLKGTATGLRILARDQRTYVVWADARDPKRPGWADIYGAVLKSSDGSALGEARAMVTTPSHSHSPVLGSSDEGIVLGWLEQGGDQAPEGARVELVRLDAEGQPVMAPLGVHTSGGTPTSLDLYCAGKTCRVMVAVDQGSRGSLEAFDFQDAHPARPKRLTRLSGPGGQSVGLALLATELFYSDLTPEGRGRMRRMLIEW